MRNAFDTIDRQCLWSILLLCLLALTSGCADLGTFAESIVGQSRIILYGLVQDQFGNPVEGAEVLYEVERFSLPFPRFSKGKVKTGRDGRFKIRESRGSQLFINEIRLAHYDDMCLGDVKGYEFRDFYTDCFKPDKSKPEVFVIRKKEKDSVFLYKRDIKCELPYNDKDKWRGIDLRNGGCKPSRSKTNPQYFFDIELTWEYDKEKKTMELCMRAANEHTSFQVLDQKLYAAPEDGYVQEQRFTIDCSKSMEKPSKHIYVRFRKPGFYARFDLTSLYPCTGQYLCFEAEGVVNPYGDRCLEPLVCLIDIKEIYEASKDDRKLNALVEKSCNLFVEWSKEAKDAIRHQKLAPRPDFDKWVKEGLAIY